MNVDYRTMTQGDRKPNLEVTITDSRPDVNFQDAESFKLVAEMNGETVISEDMNFLIAQDGSSATVTYGWQPGQTDKIGRMWVSIEVTWIGGSVQTFPDEGPLRLDIIRSGE